MRKRKIEVDGDHGVKLKTEDGKELNGALSRGLAILQAFCRGDRYLGNADLAERIGLAKPTVSRLTQTLSDLGFLRYSDATGKYQLTPAVLSLGYSALVHMEIHTLARPLMQQVASDSGMSVALGVRDGLDMVIIEYAQGHYASGLLNVPIGGRIPIAATTMGWACVYGLAAAEQAQIFQALKDAQPVAADAIQTRILSAFDEIHQTGFCMGLGEFSPAHNTVAVPLLHPNGTTMLALSLIGPTYFVPREDLLAKWGPALRAVASQLRGEG